MTSRHRCFQAWSELTPEGSATHRRLSGLGTTLFSGCLLGLLVALSLLATSQAASAAPIVYVSLDGSGTQPTTFVPLLPSGTTQTVELWMNAGPTPSSDLSFSNICNNDPFGDPVILGGDGDETCGIHLRLQMTGDVQVTGFNSSLGIVRSTDLLGGGVSLFEAAWSTIDAPVAPGPFMLGTIDVDTTGVEGGVGSIIMLQTVDADLDLIDGVVGDIFSAVPEPGLVPLLFWGVLGLRALPRRSSPR